MTHPLCANAHGFSLHAAVRCAAEQRSELEHLCRYITRPAIANERLSVNHAGQVVLKLKTPYRDGTSHLVMSPLEFMQRLAALVPRPRLTSDPLSRGACASRQAARRDCADSRADDNRARNRLRPCAWRAGAHELGLVVEACVRL